MSDSKDTSNTGLEIQTCSNCGNPVLIGDDFCSLCGQGVLSVEDRLKQQPPNVVAMAGLGIGVLIGLAGLGMSSPLNIVAFVIALGAISGGGLYYAGHLLWRGDTRREKLGKKKRWW